MRPFIQCTGSGSLFYTSLCTILPDARRGQSCALAISIRPFFPLNGSKSMLPFSCCFYLAWIGYWSTSITRSEPLHRHLRSLRLCSPNAVLAYSAFQVVQSDSTDSGLTNSPNFHSNSALGDSLMAPEDCTFAIFELVLRQVSVLNCTGGTGHTIWRCRGILPYQLRQFNGATH